MLGPSGKIWRLSLCLCVALALEQRVYLLVRMVLGSQRLSRLAARILG